MIHLLVFLVGMSVGVVVGIAVIGLMSVNKDRDSEEN